MARMYRYYEFDGFPELDQWQPVVFGKTPQLLASLPEQERTTIRDVGQSDNPAFRKYFVEHETGRETVWRRESEIIRGCLIEVLEFHIFRHKEEGYFLVEASERVVRELCRRLSLRSPELKVRMREVDLPQARAALSATVSGGQFGGLTIDNVSSAAIFGPDVGESDMWGYLTEHGDLNALWLRFSYLGSHQVALVTRTGGVMPLTTAQENAALDMVRAVNELVSPFSSLVEQSIRRRSKG